jgi:GDP-L-fucose synthase
MNPENVLVAGAAGMVGAAICRSLDAAGISFYGATRQEGDLTSRREVDDLIAGGRYDWLVIAAAKVGGIHANDTYPAEFLFENLMIEANLIDAAYRAGIEHILFLGSSCIYPRDADQPMSEPALLTGPLEATNEPYAIAKIAGIKLCESYNRQYGTDYRSLMPTNLYGPGDNYHPENSHVIPALMRRFHEAKLAGLNRVTVWGSGKPRREFLHVDDLAAASLHVMGIEAEKYQASVPPRCSHLNVGTGQDVTIGELAATMKKVVGLDAELEFDTSKPDGTPRKLLDVARLAELGWSARIDLESGLGDAYQWFKDNVEAARH